MFFPVLVLLTLASCPVDNPLSRLQVPARAHAAVRSLPRGPGRGKMDVSGNGVYPQNQTCRVDDFDYLNGKYVT